MTSLHLNIMHIFHGFRTQWKTTLCSNLQWKIVYQRLAQDLQEVCEEADWSYDFGKSS